MLRARLKRCVSQETFTRGVHGELLCAPAVFGRLQAAFSGKPLPNRRLDSIISARMVAVEALDFDCVEDWLWMARNWFTKHAALGNAPDRHIQEGRATKHMFVTIDGEAVSQRRVFSQHCFWPLRLVAKKYVCLLEWYPSFAMSSLLRLLFAMSRKFLLASLLSRRCLRRTGHQRAKCLGRPCSGIFQTKVKTMKSRSWAGLFKLGLQPTPITLSAFRQASGSATDSLDYDIAATGAADTNLVARPDAGGNVKTEIDFDECFALVERDEQDVSGLQVVEYNAAMSENEHLKNRTRNWFENCKC